MKDFSFEKAVQTNFFPRDERKDEPPEVKKEMDELIRRNSVKKPRRSENDLKNMPSKLNRPRVPSDPNNRSKDLGWAGDHYNN